MPDDMKGSDWKTLRVKECEYDTLKELKKVIVQKGYEKLHATLGVEWFDGRERLTNGKILQAACYHLLGDLHDEEDL